MPGLPSGSQAPPADCGIGKTMARVTARPLPTVCLFLAVRNELHSCSCFSELKGRKPDASQMQQKKEPNALTCFHQYLPPADVSLVKLLLAVRKIHNAVTLNICSVVVICKSASPGQVII